MDIRDATEADIPQIVSLLKLSLGESLMPKSERYWRWKHLENPFGPSPVLLCWVGSQLVGVRAFMRWEWKGHGKVYKAVRAVDTATHPDYQGKGIFKKLTLSLVASCKEDGTHFVFNTPNMQSKPGYLKMGWEEVGRLPIAVSIKRPFSIFKKSIFKSLHLSTFEDSSVNYYLTKPGFEYLVKERDPNAFSTNLSIEYIKWRYSQVPVAKYVAIAQESGSGLNGVILGRIKQTRYGTELRLTDYFFTKHLVRPELMDKLNLCIKEWGIDFVTKSASFRGLGDRIIDGSYIRAPAGPMVTIRGLGLTDLRDFKKFNSWSPSLGDLELF